MRSKPIQNETTPRTKDDDMAEAVRRWLAGRRGRGMNTGAAESFGRFPGGRWRLYHQRPRGGAEQSYMLWVFVRPNRPTKVRLPTLPETSTAELRAKWCEISAPQVYATWHASQAMTVVVASPLPEPKAKKR